MGADRMNYYRVTCDEGDCKAYINIAAVDDEHLTEVLAAQQSGRPPRGWLKPSWLSPRVYCPIHAEGQE